MKDLPGMLHQIVSVSCCADLPRMRANAIKCFLLIQDSFDISNNGVAGFNSLDEELPALKVRAGMAALWSTGAISS